MSNDVRKFKTGISVTGSATVSGDVVTTNTASQTLVNKSIDGNTNTLTNIPNSALSSGIDASKITNVPSGNLAATDIQSAVNELQSDIDTRALDTLVIKKDGSVTFTADQSFGGFKATSLADPTASQDAVTLSYMNARLNGLTPKAPVRAATLIGEVLLTSFDNGSVIDSVTLATGDRILVKNQTNPEENGIYIVNAVGAPTRASDMDSVTPFDEFNGAWTAVQEGSQAGQVFVQYGVVTVVDTDPVNFSFYSPIAGLIGGDMITFGGSTFSVDLATVSGLESSNPANVAGQLRVKLEAAAPSLQINGSNELGVKLDAAGAIVSGASGAAVQVDGSSIEISSNALQVKDAGITNAKVAAGIDAVKIADGSVNNAEFQRLDGVTSPIQTQLDGKATTSLNNLASVAFSADLIPDGNSTRDIGSSANKIATAHLNTANIYSSVGILTSGGTNRGQVLADSTMPSGTTANMGVRANAANNLGIYTDEQTAASTNSAAVRIETGNATGTTSNSANIVLKSGTATGTRGSVVVDALNLDLSSTKIINVANPTSAQDVATKDYVDNAATGSAGDIAQTSFAMANNQSTAADVTGLLFANASVRSFTAEVSVAITATASLYEKFELKGVQVSGDWLMSIEAVGNNSLVNFTITSAGQVQYTSASYTGFSAADIRFRAIVTNY